MTAWHDRKYTYPGLDAPDLVLYLKSYLDCGNLDRATSEHQDLFNAEAYDFEAAGARLLARDLVSFLIRVPFVACWRYSRARPLKRAPY